MPTTLLLSERNEACPGRATVALQADGRCELEFDEPAYSTARSFPCSVSSLLDVGLGVKLHVASSDGECTASRDDDQVRFVLSARRGDPTTYEVPLDLFVSALTAILAEKAGILENRPRARGAAPSGGMLLL